MNTEADLIARWDLIEVTDDHADYPSEDVGMLALQRDGQHVQYVADVAEAIRLVAAAEALDVRAVEADNYFAGQRWTFELDPDARVDAAAVVAALNAYVGDNVWEDVIYSLDGYDGAKTEAADPYGRSDVVVLTDGTVIRYVAQAGEWTIES